MNSVKNNILKSVISGLVVCLGGGLLVACSDSSADAKKVEKKVEIKQQASSDVEEKFAAENKPQSLELPVVALAEPSEYLDMLNPMTALRIYSAQRNWDETPEDIVDSVKNPILVRDESPDLYKEGHEFVTTQDAFRKRELSEKIVAIVKSEAEKVGTHRLVKVSTSDHLDAYDFGLKGFKVSSCTFSDKLEYTKEEMRSQSSYARAGKTRCYYHPGPQDYLIGLTGGSKVFLDVADEALARKIEAARNSANVVVYGYVKSVERERMGGRFGPKRYVLVAPQRIDVVDEKSGSVLLTKVL